jgi:hypothetical protein
MITKQQIYDAITPEKVKFATIEVQSVVDTLFKMIAAADITDEDIDNILVCALEGGINYWCREAIVAHRDYRGADYASHVVSKGGTLILHLDEPEDGPPQPLNRDNIIKGIAMAAEHKKQSIIMFLENHDAGDADAAVQFAVFDKLIYG